MELIYLSPHLDDAAYSCGGLIWTQTEGGHNVQVWTICAGKYPKAELSSFAAAIHKRWNLPVDPVEVRKREDKLSCQILGADWLHLNIPDAIYRIDRTFQSVSNNSGAVHLYPDDPSLLGPLHPADEGLVGELSDILSSALTDYRQRTEYPQENPQLVCPLAVGNHVDHQLTRRAIERLSIDPLYYADFPYVMNGNSEIDRLKISGKYKELHNISDDAMDAWRSSIQAYQSQLSTFWKDTSALQNMLSSYLEAMGGMPIWGYPAAKND